MIGKNIAISMLSLVVVFQFVLIVLNASADRSLGNEYGELDAKYRVLLNEHNSLSAEHNKLVRQQASLSTTNVRDTPPMPSHTTLSSSHPTNYAFFENFYGRYFYGFGNSEHPTKTFYRELNRVCDINSSSHHRKIFSEKQNEFPCSTRSTVRTFMQDIPPVSPNGNLYDTGACMGINKMLNSFSHDYDVLLGNKINSADEEEVRAELTRKLASEFEAREDYVDDFIEDLHKYMNYWVTVYYNSCV